MALQNECVECDSQFYETKKHKGCLCPTCKQELEDKALLEAKDNFWIQLEEKLERG